MTQGINCVPLSTAEIIAVGSELLTPFRSDTNSLFLTARLNELGIEVRRKSIVGDDPADLGSAVTGALARVDLLVICGGLGPTDDDLTRETVAGVLGMTLREDPSICERLITRFASFGWAMPENNRRQALIPEGAVVLDNPRGTAPGLWLERGPQVVILLPGPPRELEPMFATVARDLVALRAVPERLYRRVLRVAGRGESHVEELAQPVYCRWRAGVPPVLTTVLALPGLVELHLSTRATSEAAATATLDGATGELAAVLGEHLFSTDGRSLPEVVGHLLEQQGLRVAVGESCTGGILTAYLVDVPGSSNYVEIGMVAYSNEIKRVGLGVDPALLETNGAVSEDVALAMAEGARRFGVTPIGLGVTGVAGPGGGSDDKPVGTVCLAVAGPDDERITRTVLFPGDRAMIRQLSAVTALDMLRRVLLRRTRDRELVRGG